MIPQPDIADSSGASAQLNLSRTQPYFNHSRLTVVTADKPGRTLEWRELWAYRELLWVLTT